MLSHADRLHLLVVEDDEPLRQLLEMLLAEELNVTGVGSGKEAISFIKKGGREEKNVEKTIH